MIASYGLCEILSEEQKDLHQNKNFMSICVIKNVKNISSNVCVKVWSQTLCRPFRVTCCIGIQVTTLWPPSRSTLRLWTLKGLSSCQVRTGHVLALCKIKPKIYTTVTKRELGVLFDTHYSSLFRFSSTFQVNMGKMGRTLFSQTENT